MRGVNWPALRLDKQQHQTSQDLGEHLDLARYAAICNTTHRRPAGFSQTEATFHALTRTQKEAVDPDSTAATNESAQDETLDLQGIKERFGGFITTTATQRQARVEKLMGVHLDATMICAVRDLDL